MIGRFELDPEARCGAHTLVHRIIAGLLLMNYPPAHMAAGAAKGKAVRRMASSMLHMPLSEQITVIEHYHGRWKVFVYGKGKTRNTRSKQKIAPPILPSVNASCYSGVMKWFEPRQ